MHRADILWEYFHFEPLLSLRILCTVVSSHRMCIVNMEVN